MSGSPEQESLGGAAVLAKAACHEWGQLEIVCTEIALCECAVEIFYEVLWYGLSMPTGKGRSGAA